MIVFARVVPLSLLALWLAVPPAGAADAAKGGEIAKRWCTACHLVSADQERAPTVAPPFGTIAKRPGFDVRQLQQSLQAPHPQMPARGLSREEAEDIAAYIATLR
jgi:mono/diheme cytochrome c family protein